MKNGEQWVGSVGLKDRFRDAHERRSYLRAVHVARRIVDDPSLLDAGRVFLDRFVRDDPRQSAGYALWLRTLELAPGDIALRLIEDSEAGEALRDSAPVFAVISKTEAEDIWRANS